MATDNVITDWLQKEIHAANTARQTVLRWLADECRRSTTPQRHPVNEALINLDNLVEQVREVKRDLLIAWVNGDPDEIESLAHLVAQAVESDSTLPAAELGLLEEVADLVSHAPDCSQRISDAAPCCCIRAEILAILCDNGRSTP